MAESDAASHWPTFPTLADLSERELDAYLDEADPPPEGQAFTGFAETFRRRRRLLSPPLIAAALRDDVFQLNWPGDPSPDHGLVDVVLIKGYIAEMPQRSFEAKIVIGADHEFTKNRKSAASHARVIEGATRNAFPINNIPFLQRLKASPGGSLCIHIVFLDGKTSRAAITFLKSDLFKAGIKLTRSFNPVFGTAAQYISSLTVSLLASGKNRVVSQGIFGLHNYGGPGSGSFGIGDYLFAQLPEDIVARAGEGKLTWDRASNRVMDGSDPLDANYVLLRFRRSPDRTNQDA